MARGEGYEEQQEMPLLLLALSSLPPTTYQTLAGLRRSGPAPDL